MALYLILIPNRTKASETRITRNTTQTPNPMLAIFVVFMALVIGIILMTTVFSLSAGKKHRSNLPEATTTEDSISVGELKSMIRDAVAESNAPLQDRLNRLENHLPSDKHYLGDHQNPQEDVVRKSPKTRT